ASTSRASTPDTTTIGVVRAVHIEPTQGVALSMPGVFALADEPPLITTRGSLAEANGSAFLIVPARSKLSPTAYRAELCDALSDQISLLKLVCANVSESWNDVGTDATSAAAAENWPRSTSACALAMVAASLVRGATESLPADRA